VEAAAYEAVRREGDPDQHLLQFLLETNPDRLRHPPARDP
jgi:hypothetical protein